jgi:deoxyribodipyrimidine photolyase
MVDAGIRQLNENQLRTIESRIVVASFFMQAFIVEWQWGETLFCTKIIGL